MAKIMIVSADQASTRELKRMLELEGHEVVTATTIVAARNKRSKGFRLEIWDASFKEGQIDGAREALELFNHDGKTILLYTANREALDLAATYEAPRLPKPTADSAMRAVVGQLVAGGQQHET